jgi:hypothetical protein
MAGWCIGFDAGFGAYPGIGTHILLQPGLADGAPGNVDAETRFGGRRIPCSLPGEWHDLRRHFGKRCHGQHGVRSKYEPQRQHPGSPPALEYEGFFCRRRARSARLRRHADVYASADRGLDDLARDGPARRTHPVRKKSAKQECGYWSASTARSSAFDTGASPVRYLSSSPQESVGGTPGSTAGGAGSDLTSPTLPAGGLPGLIQDYMRLNPDGGAAR